jgi:predicted nucleotide-binding protein
MVSVFISHSSKDKFIARKLAEELEKNGVTVWIDEAEIRIGDSLIKKISDAVKKTDYVAVILTTNSVQSS